MDTPRIDEALAGYICIRGREPMHLPDGRILLWWRTIPEQDSNKIALYRGMEQRGVLVTREEEAINATGESMPEHVVFRFDSRIGKERVNSLRHFVMDRLPGLMGSVDQQDVAYNPMSINELLDKGMIETGLNKIIAGLRYQDVARPLGQVAEHAINDNDVDV